MHKSRMRQCTTCRAASLTASTVPLFKGRCLKLSPAADGVAE